MISHSQTCDTQQQDCVRLNLHHHSVAPMKLRSATLVF